MEYLDRKRELCAAQLILERVLTWRVWKINACFLSAGKQMMGRAAQLRMRLSLEEVCTAVGRIKDAEGLSVKIQFKGLERRLPLLAIKVVLYSLH